MTYRIYYDGTMTVIAVIEQPAVIRQILDHLGLPTGAAGLRAPPDQTRGRLGDQPREWSYDPAFDLPVRRTQTGDLPGPAPAIA